jgi:hypothetical protein
MEKSIVIGQYHSNFNQSGRELYLCISPGDVYDSWRRCGMVSDFASHYMSMEYEEAKKVSNSLSFIVNELLENAVKYSGDGNEKIYITLVGTEDHEIVCQVENGVNSDQYERLQRIAQQFLDREEVKQKYIRALTDDRMKEKESGIGLMTIVSYFNVQISMKLTEPEKSRFRTSIQVRANVRELS